MKRTSGLAVFLFLLGLFAGVAGVSGQEGPPSYSVHYLGLGSVVALNNVNTVVGVRTDAASGVQTPLVSAAGGAWAILPSPAGATSVVPTDINDAGVIVGVASMPNGRRAIRWTPADAGYAVELLPLLPGEVASYATAINNLGQIVGARAGILGTPYGFGWLYSDAGGLVDLNAAYGWFATPNDINDAGVILAGTQTFDLASRTLTNVGLSGPSNYNAVGGVAINNSGAIAGSASLRSTSLNIVSVFRYLPESGWQFISGSSRYTVANDINNLGDVGWGEQGAGLYLDGLGAFALFTLLDPAAAAAGWTITGNGCLINDQRAVATAGRNAITGVAGAVLLTHAGILPPPAAPTNLIATPHPATASEPYLSIDLSWHNGDVLLTKYYELERSPTGQAAWTPVTLVPPAMATFHQDTTVSPATTYDYRVRAAGVAGPGPWSAIATATAPAVPLDTTPPQVTIVAPVNGAEVSGIVAVSAEASDDVGVELLEISYWNQYLGKAVVLGSVAKAGSLTVNWDTRGLTPAAYAVRAFAHDTIGNWRQAEISVNVNQPLPSMHVSSIALSGRVQKGIANISGTVYVKDASMAAVRNASVTARWSLPGGVTVTATKVTDAGGRAQFAVSGARGTYTLTVTDVAKSGYRFDAAGSVLAKSLTK